MDSPETKLKKAFEAFRERTSFSPKLILVLGTGLGNAASDLETEEIIGYGEIPGLPVSTADGHEGRFLLGRLTGIETAVMQGRVHYYEGYEPYETVMPLRLLRLAGASVIFLTCAAGGINKSFKAGDFMLLDDHISFFAPSPLRGANLHELGTRFPDMTEVYDRELRRMIRESAASEKIDLKEGVYIQTSGPNFETPSEIKLCAALGADAVGMSTVSEAIASRHASMRVCAIAMISNMGCGISEKPLSAEEVFETSAERGQDFKRLLLASISRMADNSVFIK